MIWGYPQYRKPPYTCLIRATCGSWSSFFVVLSKFSLPTSCLQLLFAIVLHRIPWFFGKAAWPPYLLLQIRLHSHFRTQIWHKLRSHRNVSIDISLRLSNHPTNPLVTCWFTCRAWKGFNAGPPRLDAQLGVTPTCATGISTGSWWWKWVKWEWSSTKPLNH